MTWAGRADICLAEESGEELAVYCGSGAFVRQTQLFIKQLSSRHNVKIYDDYFVFKQLLEHKQIATFTTRLVRHYRNDGEKRIVIPLRDEGITAIYRLSYLRKNRKHIAPLLEWIQKNNLFLFDNEKLI